MFENGTVSVKNRNLEFVEMTLEELRRQKYKHTLPVLGMVYVKGGIVYDYIPFSDLRSYKNNGSGLFELIYETPEGLRKNFVCDSTTEIMASGMTLDEDTGKYVRWSTFVNVLDLDNHLYICDITGKKCKVVSVKRVESHKEPLYLYHLNTKFKNVFVNGILVKCR